MLGEAPNVSTLASVEPGEVVEVRTDRIAGGGDAVGRGPDGRVVFVEAALPGETVRARVTRVRRRHAHAVATEVLVAGPGRRPEPCPEGERGCGGCGWQHATEELQAEMRLRIVEDALRRIGRIADPVVEPGATVPPHGTRTTVRAAVVDGRAGHRRRRGHDRVAVASCRVLHPGLEELLVEGRYGDAEEVVLRVGARTGERLALVRPTADGVVVPDDVVVVGDDALDASDTAGLVVHEVMAGRRWRVSARSFLQPSPEAAEALVAEVDDAVSASGVDPTDATLVDLACGIGLFAGTVGDRFARVIGVDSSADAVADARVNLAGRDGVEVVRATIRRWRPGPADVVVADPPRSGLASDGVERIVASGAGAVVLVSCDAGSLGRDAGLLAEAGYRPVRSRVLGAFPQTPHVEVVTLLTRVPAAAADTV